MGSDERRSTAVPLSWAVSPRPRREVPGPLLLLLRPLFRYSEHRDAYVLRWIGNERGPVLRTRRSALAEAVDGDGGSIAVRRREPAPALVELGEEGLRQGTAGVREHHLAASVDELR